MSKCLVLNSHLYNKLLDEVSSLDLNLNELNGKTILIAGAAGGIGSFFIDILMRNSKQKINIIALGRNKDRLKARFNMYSNVLFHTSDITKDIPLVECDYIINAASNTHPIQYASYPIDTIMTNILGTRNLLDLAATQKECRLLFLSSVEIYGQNKGDVNRFSEDYCGYIDCNSLRAGYPESKRAGESLCQAYAAEKGVDFVILRLARTYSPTMASDDSKAIAQLIRNAINKEDIILKSDGASYFSYAFIADAISALLYTMLYGKSGEVYNVASDESDITLKNLAQTIANIAGVNVKFQTPNAVEARGFSTTTKALLDTTKLKKLGWRSRYNIEHGLEQTIRILNEVNIGDK
jgi:nucleoside-diphosphate-sugar epimerase